MPITQQGSSFSLIWPCTGSSSSSTFPLSASLELTISRSLFQIVNIISKTSVRALWSSIPRLLLPLYLPNPGTLLCQHHQLAFSPLWFLSQWNCQSMSLALHCLRSALPNISQLHSSFSIASCVMPQVLRLLLLSNHSCLHSLDEVVGWTVLSICYICPPKVVTSSHSEQ